MFLCTRLCQCSPPTKYTDKRSLALIMPYYTLEIFLKVVAKRTLINWRSLCGKYLMTIYMRTLVYIHVYMFKQVYLNGFAECHVSDFRDIQLNNLSNESYNQDYHMDDIDYAYNFQKYLRKNLQVCFTIHVLYNLTGCKHINEMYHQHISNYCFRKNILF